MNQKERVHFMMETINLLRNEVCDKAIELQSSVDDCPLNDLGEPMHREKVECLTGLGRRIFECPFCHKEFDR